MFNSSAVTVADVGGFTFANCSIDCIRLALYRKNYEECMNTQLRSLPFHGSSAVEMESTARTPPGSARLLYLYKLIGHLISLHNITQSGLQIPVQRGMGTSIDLETIERMLYSANKRCFGTHLRSPALGTRHIDKGVYIDQIIRWYASFKPFQFHVGTLESFALAPVERLQDILDFLAVPSAAGSGIGIFGTSTDADTQLTDLRTPISLNKSDVHSRANIGLRKYDALVNQLDFGKKRLERPNKRIPELSSVGEKQLSALYAFYKPYNELLLLFNISL